jgi:MoaA/NifB/PqqE/SkfB family radical SAM enzyme
MKEDVLSAAIEALLEKELKGGRTIELPVKGGTLAPRLLAGDRVIIRPLSLPGAEGPESGAVVLLAGKSGGSPELLRYGGFDRETGAVFLFDPATGKAFTCPSSRVLGSVSAVKRPPAATPAPFSPAALEAKERLSLLRLRARLAKNKIRWKLLFARRFFATAADLKTGRSRVADILITDTCPVECRFCLYACTASGGHEMPIDLFERICRGYAEAGIGHLRILGGEPFAVPPLLVACHETARRYFPPDRISIVTSGYWGGSEQSIRKNLEPFLDINPLRLVLSVDAFHLEKIPIASCENILRFCRGSNVSITVNIHYSEALLPILPTLERWKREYRFDLLFSEVFEVGRAASLSREELSAQGLAGFRAALGEKGEPPFESCFRWVAFPDENIYFCCMKQPHALAGTLSDAPFEAVREKAKRSYPANLLRTLKFVLTPQDLKRTPCPHCPLKIG